MRRKFPICTEEIYHIYTKSIYRYVIFDTDEAYRRLHRLIQYYQYDGMTTSFSTFLKGHDVAAYGFEEALARLVVAQKLQRRVKIISFCYMPTHLHLIAKQLLEDGIMLFMHQVLTAYTKYFNLLHNRRGPLWQERFGAARIRDEEELILKTGYLHNNPIKDLGQRRPDSWDYSSYHEFAGKPPRLPAICDWSSEISLTSSQYAGFFKAYRKLF